MGCGDLLHLLGVSARAGPWASREEGKNRPVGVGAKAHLALCKAERAQRVLLIIILISNIFWQRTKVCLAEADGRGGKRLLPYYGEEATASKRHRLQMLEGG